MKLVAYLADLFPSMPDAHLATVATTQGLLCTLLDTAGQGGDSTTPQLSGTENVWMKPPTSTNQPVERRRSGTGPQGQAQYCPSAFFPKREGESSPGWWPVGLAIVASVPHTTFPLQESSLGVPGVAEEKPDLPCLTFPSLCRAHPAGPFTRVHALSFQLSPAGSGLDPCWPGSSPRADGGSLAEAQPR